MLHIWFYLHPKVFNLPCCYATTLIQKPMFTRIYKDSGKQQTVTDNFILESKTELVPLLICLNVMFVTIKFQLSF